METLAQVIFSSWTCMSLGVFIWGAKVNGQKLHFYWSWEGLEGELSRPVLTGEPSKKSSYSQLSQLPPLWICAWFTTRPNVPNWNLVSQNKLTLLEKYSLRLREHSHAPWPMTASGPSGQSTEAARDSQNLKYLLYGPLQEKFAKPCSIRIQPTVGLIP